MRNLTISVSDSLKDEMDTLSEVNWSEVCRNAISRYIAQRKNPTPNIDLDLRNARLTHYDFQTGYPTLTLDLRMHNKMDSEIMVDRVISNIRFFQENIAHAIGVAYDLRKKIIGPHSVGGARIHLPLYEEKLRKLRDKFDSTFDCHATCIVFVEGFRNAFNLEVKAIIPIDQWNDVVKKALGKNQATKVDR